MAVSGPTFDPITTATGLAEQYVSAQRQILASQSSRTTSTEKGLTELSAALSAFQTKLSSLTGLNQSMFAQSATFSDTSVGTATASPTAATGSYAFVVERLATASQVSYSNLPGTPTTGSGKLTVRSGSTSFEVDIAAADTDKDDTVSVRELAAAINGASGNTSLVSASVVTIGSSTQLVLTSKKTGIANAATLEATNVTNAALKTALTTPANVKEITAGQDAVVWLGAQTTGTRIQQASNTVEVIDGVKMTFTKTSSQPVALTVGADSSATTANVQGFVDAYNKLKGILDAMVASADPKTGSGGGAFAGDSGIKALRDRLVSLLRPSGGDSLANYGISANRQGTLTLDTTRLNKALALNPNGLDTLIGSTASGKQSGIAAALDKYIKGWTSSADGQIKTRKDAVSRMQLQLTARQETIDKQYDSAYNRYLAQFTQLQNIQSQMSSNNSMFEAMFSSDRN